MKKYECRNKINRILQGATDCFVVPPINDRFMYQFDNQQIASSFLLAMTVRR